MLSAFAMLAPTHINNVMLKEEKMKSIITKNGHFYFIIISIIISFCYNVAQADAAPLVSTDKDSYNYGEVIKVNFSNALGKESDWICIVPSGSPDTEAGDYKNMPKGLTEGVLIFNSPSPGKYELRAYYDYSHKGYVVSARHSFLVKSTPEYVKEAGQRKITSTLSEDRTIEKVFEAPGYSKEQIFNGAKIWISENFRSAKAVLEYENKEAGTIIGNGIIPYPHGGFFEAIAKEGWEVPFTMRVDTKDQKFRLTFTNLRLKWDAQYKGRAAYDGPIGRQADFDTIKPVLLNFGDKIIASFGKDTIKSDW